MNELKAGAVLNYVAIGLNVIIGLTYTPYMLRMLGQSEYGLYSLAASIIAYLTVLDLGFGNAIVRYTAKFRAEKKEREQEEMFGMFLADPVGLEAHAPRVYAKMVEAMGDIDIAEEIIEVSKDIDQSVCICELADERQWVFLSVRGVFHPLRHCGKAPPMFNHG